MKVWVETRRIKRRWWFGYSTTYHVCTEFMSWEQPTEAEACISASTLRQQLRY